MHGSWRGVAVLVAATLGASLGLGGAACGGGAPPRGHAGAKGELRAAHFTPARPAPLAFAWGVPCRVPAVRTDIQKGQAVKQRYDVVLEPSPDGTELRLRLEHTEFLEINGQDVTPPALRAQLAAARELSDLAPALRIARAGDYLGVVDLPQYAARVVDVSTAGKDAEAAKQFRAVMLTPHMLELMNNQMGDIWKNWVEAWIGVSLVAGQTVSGSSTIHLAGQDVAVPTRMARLADTAGAPGRVRLHAETTMRGAAFAGLFDDLIAELTAGMAKVPPAGQVIDVDRQEIDEVDTDPVTLRPYRARLEVTTRIALKAGEPLTRHDWREVVFAWDRAVGACATR